MVRIRTILFYCICMAGGASTCAYDYVFTRKWSDVYNVVTWDQRNCGKIILIPALTG